MTSVVVFTDYGLNYRQLIRVINDRFTDFVRIVKFSQITLNGGGVGDVKITARYVAAAFYPTVAVRFKLSNDTLNRGNVIDVNITVAVSIAANVGG